MGAGADAMSDGRNGDSHRDAGYDSSGKSPGQIEEDISDTRAELGEILDELERKLAPRHLLERGLDMLKDGMSGDVGGIGETLRRHPVPLALIGIGIGWVAIRAATGRGRLGEYGHDIRDRVSSAVQGAAGKVGEAAGQFRDKVAGMAATASTSSVAPAPYPTESAGYAYAREKSGAAMAKAWETAAEAGSAARDTIRQAQEAGSTVRQRAGQYASEAGDRLLGTRDRLTGLIEANPLAVGAVGFLAGSLLALMLPRSRIEAQLIGQTSEQIARAAERARRVAERPVGTAMGAVKEAVSEAAEAVPGRQG
jgi:hypothetical protein